MTNPDRPQPRGGNGRWVRTAEGRERDRLALEMRSRGRTWREIAETLGYPDEGNAHRGVQNALKEGHIESVEEMRQQMAARLDELNREAMEVLEAKHIKLHEGKPVYIGPEGEEVEVLDDAPVLRAAETILKIEQRRAALFGLDAPSKTEIAVTSVKFSIDGLDPGDV